MENEKGPQNIQFKIAELERLKGEASSAKQRRIDSEIKALRQQAAHSNESVIAIPTRPEQQLELLRQLNERLGSSGDLSEEEYKTVERLESVLSQRAKVLNSRNLQPDLVQEIISAVPTLQQEIKVQKKESVPESFIAPVLSGDGQVRKESTEEDLEIIPEPEVDPEPIPQIPSQQPLEREGDVIPEPDYGLMTEWMPENVSPKEVEVVRKELEQLSPKEKETLGWGLNALAFRAGAIKDKTLSKAFKFAASKVNDRKDKQTDSVATNFFGMLSKQSEDNIEKAKKRVLEIQEGKDVTKNSLSNVGFLASGTIKYARAIADFAGWTTLLPTRYVTLGAMAVGSLAEAAKNTRALEMNRIKDVDAAAEEAWALYNSAKEQAADGEEVTPDLLKSEFRMKMSQDVLEKLAAEKGDVRTSIISRLFTKRIEKQAEAIRTELTSIDENSDLSSEAKEEEKRKVLENWTNSRTFKSLAELLTKSGQVDSWAASALAVEKISKTVKKAVMVETVVSAAWQGIEALRELDKDQVAELYSKGKTAAIGFAKKLTDPGAIKMSNINAGMASIGSTLARDKTKHENIFARHEPNSPKLDLDRNPLSAASDNTRVDTPNVPQESVKDISTPHEASSRIMRPAGGTTLGDQITLREVNIPDRPLTPEGVVTGEQESVFDNKTDVADIFTRHSVGADSVAATSPEVPDSVEVPADTTRVDIPTEPATSPVNPAEEAVVPPPHEQLPTSEVTTEVIQKGESVSRVAEELLEKYAASHPGFDATNTNVYELLGKSEYTLPNGETVKLLELDLVHPGDELKLVVDESGAITGFEFEPTSGEVAGIELPTETMTGSPQEVAPQAAERLDPLGTEALPSSLEGALPTGAYQVAESALSITDKTFSNVFIDQAFRSENPKTLASEVGSFMGAHADRYPSPPADFQDRLQNLLVVSQAEGVPNYLEVFDKYPQERHANALVMKAVLDEYLSDHPAKLHAEKIQKLHTFLSMQIEGDKKGLSWGELTGGKAQVEIQKTTVGSLIADPGSSDRVEIQRGSRADVFEQGARGAGDIRGANVEADQVRRVNVENNVAINVSEEGLNVDGAGRDVTPSPDEQVFDRLTVKPEEQAAVLQSAPETPQGIREFLADRSLPAHPDNAEVYTFLRKANREFASALGDLDRNGGGLSQESARMLGISKEKYGMALASLRSLNNSEGGIAGHLEEIFGDKDQTRARILQEALKVRAQNNFSIWGNYSPEEMKLLWHSVGLEVPDKTLPEYPSQRASDLIQGGRIKGVEMSDPKTGRIIPDKASGGGEVRGGTEITPPQQTAPQLTPEEVERLRSQNEQLNKEVEQATAEQVPEKKRGGNIFRRVGRVIGETSGVVADVAKDVAYNPYASGKIQEEAHDVYQAARRVNGIFGGRR